MSKEQNENIYVNCSGTTSGRKYTMRGEGYFTDLTFVGNSINIENVKIRLTGV